MLDQVQGTEWYLSAVVDKSWSRYTKGVKPRNCRASKGCIVQPFVHLPVTKPCLLGPRFHDRPYSTSGRLPGQREWFCRLDLAHRMYISHTYYIASIVGRDSSLIYEFISLDAVKILFCSTHYPLLNGKKKKTEKVEAQDDR